MSKVNFKHQLFEQFARIGKSLSSGPRLELLEFLAQGERNVESLSKVSGFALANTSQHLRQLHQSGLVVTRKVGQQVFYRLANEMVVDLLNILRQVAERNLAEIGRLVDTYLTVKDDLEPINSGELLQKLKSDQVTVLDVRPVEEYSEGHLPGSVNIPLDQLEEGIKSLPDGKQIVVYCRGPHCILSFEAVNRLRQKGFDAFRFEAGFPEWKRDGLPTET